MHCRLINIIVFNLFISTGCSIFHLHNDLKVTQQKSVAAEANVKLAVAFLKQGFLKDAKVKLLLAQNLDSKNPAVWYVTAYFYESIAEMEEAKKNYEKAISLAPQNGAAQNNYGVFLCRGGHYQESLKHFLLAVQDPEYLETASAYENAGLCALRIPDEELANKFFLKAMSQQSNSIMEPAAMVKN